MNEQELARLPAPPPQDSHVETATNGAGQRIYRVVTYSAWAIVPER